MGLVTYGSIGLFVPRKYIRRFSKYFYSTDLTLRESTIYSFISIEHCVAICALKHSYISVQPFS